MNAITVLLGILLLCGSTLVDAGTCQCSSGVTWYSCPNGNACHSFCSSHGGVRYWGGPGRMEIILFVGLSAILALLRM